jgi:PGF-CTERM protein
MKMDANRTVVIFIAVLVLLAMPATAAAVSVTRDLPEEPVSPNEVGIHVTLNQSGFFLNAGTVTETLPEGFKYVPCPEYNETTNELTIEFRNETSKTYIVKAGTAEQIENAVFSGTYKTLDTGLNEITGEVGGDTTLTLAEPTPTEVPPSGNGGGGGGAPTTPTPTPAVTPSPGATPTPAATPTLEGTPGVTPAITPAATPTPSPTKKPLIPGFEGIFAIAGLLAVAYLVMRRRRG